MATVSFILRGNTDLKNIYIRLVNGIGNDFKRNTGLKVHKGNWNRVKTNSKDAELKSLALDLERLKLSIIEKINQAIIDNESIDNDWLQLKLDEFYGKGKPVLCQTEEQRLDWLSEAFEKYINTIPIKRTRSKPRSAATITKYQTLKIKITNFEQYCGRKFLVKDVNIGFRDSFFEYLTKIELLSDNTAGRYLSFVKTVCLDAKIRGAETHPQLDVFTGTSEEAHKIHLTFDEINQIMETKFLRPALDNARDWLVIGCYVGQRVSDLLNITTKNIVYKNGLNLIELVQQKTNKTVLIPISEPVQQILDKRGGEFPYKISATHFNLHIKEVAKIAGINEVIEGAKTGEIKMGDKTVHRKILGKFEKWELVTSHICRRSFATNYYGEMVTSLIINITGHSTEKQFLEYVGKPPIDHAQQIAEYFTSIYRKQLVKRNNSISLHKKAE